jgi:peroxiredoxin
MCSSFRKNRIAVAAMIGILAFGTAVFGQQTKAAHNPESARESAVGHPTLAIGSPAPDFNLPGVDGKMHKLHDYDSSPILAVLFTCAHCPTAQLYETRVQKLYDEYKDKGMAMVAINPNDPKAASPTEMGYTDVNDSLEGMTIRAKYRHFTYPFLSDAETQSVAQAYGPKATPHMFLFDKDRKLRFEGRIDDSQAESKVKTQDTRNALEAMLAGKPVPVEHTAVFGCSTKWKEQIEGKQRTAKRIQSEPVNLEMVTADDLKKLRTNPTGKVLVINFWATWCGPCVEEMPELLETYYWYRLRGFDFVTVSTNAPEEKPAVLKMLEQFHATNRNLQFASDDVYAMQAAFDKTWEAGVPFTMVLAPDGKVIYRQQGDVNILAMRRAVLANMADTGGYVGHRAYWAGEK